MPPTRRKAPRQQAPQTIEEATALLGRYAGFLTEAERLRAEADQAKAAIDAARDMALAPIEQEAKGIFLQLRAWWGVAGTELTEGKRKSYEIAGCILGERTTPPSLAMPAKDEEAATILINAELSDLCRFKITVDKPADRRN
jgi:phage host-nuclease inhibitor protein Gam